MGIDCQDSLQVRPCKLGRDRAPMDKVRPGTGREGALGYGFMACPEGRHCTTLAVDRPDQTCPTPHNTLYEPVNLGELTHGI